MGIELFSAEDREILAGHIGELQLSDALLERFLASAVKQAGDFAAANEHPEPTEAEAVAYMMRNMRIALGMHTGEDGRAKGGGFLADRLMADYAEQWDDLPEEIRNQREGLESLSQYRKRIIPQLNDELARLINKRGLLGSAMPAEDTARLAEVERLLGILARVGEA